MTVLRDVTLDTTVAATPEDVWAALAEHAQRRRWWPHLELDPRPGGRLVERWRDGDGREVVTAGDVLDARPPSMLRCSWRDEDWPAATELTIELRPAGEGTHVRLRHRGWELLGADAERLAAAHRQGWERHLAAWKAAAESTPRVRVTRA